MKVYTKDGKVDSIFGAILAIIVFFSFFFFVLKSFIEIGDIVKALSDLGVGMVFALIFFLVAVYFIILLLKKPKGFIAELVKKKIQVYKGKTITYMEFLIVESKNRNDMRYFCYTYGENNLVLNKKYLIKVKELNDVIKRVEELKSDLSVKNDFIATISPYIFHYIFIFICIGMIGLCIFGIFFFVEYFVYYILTIIPFSFLLKKIIKNYKELKDNINNSDDNNI